MAPIAIADLKLSGIPGSLTFSPTASGTKNRDPSVYPPLDADERLQRLWYLHGDPQSEKLANPKLTSLAALVGHNADTEPNQPAFICPAPAPALAPDDSPLSFAVLDWLQFHRLVCKAAQFYAHSLDRSVGVVRSTSLKSVSEGQITVALLGTGSSIDYLVAQIALNRLGWRTLLLSNKNVAATRDYLLRKCDAVAVILDKGHWHEASEIRQLGLSTLGMATIGELETMVESGKHGEAGEAEKATFASVPHHIAGAQGVADEWNRQAMIIHSSGSTGMPKPIIHTNRSLCQIARMYRLLPEFVIENWYLCFPLFHIAGISIALSGLPNGLPTTLPPTNWPPAPSAILSAWKRLAEMGHPVDCLHCAPTVIEDLCEYIAAAGGDFAPLQRLRVLQPGGAPLSGRTLKRLAALGVNVKTTYGTTEIGPPFRTIPHTRDNPAVYRFRSLYPGNPLVRMEPLPGGGERGGLLECVVYKGFPLAAELWPDEDSPNPYRTGDIFVEDPPGSGYFVLQGRRDDILVHSNGEKTQAAALAMALEEQGKKASAGVVVVAKAAVFGDGKPCTSAVVEIDWEGIKRLKGARGVNGVNGVNGFDAAVGEDMTEVNVEAAVWDVVQQCNEKTSTVSRIPRVTLLILGRGETLPVTPKGNVRRTLAWEMYGDRVERLYSSLLGAGPAFTARIRENGNDGCAAASQVPQGSKNIASPDSLQVIKEAVADLFAISSRQVADDQSLYELGLDSINAVALRSRLIKTFGIMFPLMFVFEYPTPRKLHHFLCGRVSNRQDPDAVAPFPGVHESGEDEASHADHKNRHHEWVTSTVEHLKLEINLWKALLPSSRPGMELSRYGKAEADGEVVYLTGASGALGNALLEELVQKPCIKSVYCAVRGGEPEARVRDSLRSRGYPAAVYSSSKILGVSYNMKDQRLGLDEHTYEVLASNVTIVVHNAWKLDFNLPVEQYEADCLRGTMNLMAFSLKGPKKTFSFTSSIAAAMGGNLPGSGPGRGVETSHHHHHYHRRIPEQPLSSDPANALPTGYAQSKFVVEQVARHYASVFASAVAVRLLRVGQLCGHSALGCWNASEMWPMMIATGLGPLRGAMPVLPGRTVDWLPVDACASAACGVFLNTSSSSSSSTPIQESSSGVGARVGAEAGNDDFLVANLVNPNSISWEALLSLLEQATGRQIERVKMAEWVARLETTATPVDVDGPDGADGGNGNGDGEMRGREVPGLKLLGFFQSMSAGENGNGDGVLFEASRVGDAPRLDVEMARAWLEGWREVGFLRA